MDVYTMTEESYKNGYSDGINKFAIEIKEEMWQMCLNEDMCALYPFSFVDKILHRLEKEIGIR